MPLHFNPYLHHTLAEWLKERPNPQKDTKTKIMNAAVNSLEELMTQREDERLEFKEAKTRYDFEELVKYCVALANEGGGKIILGVSDQRPRQVVGSEAFQNLEQTKANLVERLRLRMDVEELRHPNGRVIIISVPSRPLGIPIQYKGAYWMRAGETLTPMTQDLLKRIFDEGEPDFSARVCQSALFEDLDIQAIESFRSLWIRKSANAGLAALTPQQLLDDAELVVNGGVTYAALILFGTHRALGRYLSQAEVIFEYRSSEASIPSGQRKEYRVGFFLMYDDLWNTINLRNDVQQFQDGLFVWDIPTFNEAVVREAILNAISHRDYRLAGSVFIRQFPRRLDIVSPGGFPIGITLDNILWRQVPRNRRIAEAFSKCGLVERAGQGVNRMYEECIKESKPKPDFSGSDDYQVSVVLNGQIQDPKFLRFLERVGREILASFTTQDFLVLDYLYQDQPLPEELKIRIPGLVDKGVVETIGRGKYTRYMLSRNLYGFLGEKGVYTRKRGLDRETNKALLLKHIRDNQSDGSRLEEMMQVLPALSRREVQKLLAELKAANFIYKTGHTKAARWYPRQQV